MLRWIAFLGRLLYRVWFYIVAGIPIVLLSPILIGLSLFSSGYPALYWIARNLWTPFVLFGMGTPIVISRETPENPNTSYIIGPNHSSMLDLFCVLRLSKKPVLFVGKMQLKWIPIFGYLFKNVSVLVNRSSKESRTQVYETVKLKLKKSYSLCIFPEGMVPKESVLLSPFKDGAFKIAIEQQMDFLPVSIYNTKFIFPYSFHWGGPSTIRIHVHSPMATKEMDYEAFPELRDRVYELLRQDLEADQKKRHYKGSSHPFMDSVLSEGSR